MRAASDNRGGNGVSRLYDPKMKLKKGGILSKIPRERRCIKKIKEDSGNEDEKGHGIRF